MRPRAFFEVIAKNLSLSQTTLTFEPASKSNEVSLRLSYLIGSAGEAHTIGERLIKPCLIEATRCLLGEEKAENFQAIALSNNTVSRRIHDLASWLEAEVCSEMRGTSHWALQLDESTDVSGSAILLAFVRYVHEFKVCEELLFCKALEGRTTGEAIFDRVDAYLKENNLSWDMCVNVCTDAAAAMRGMQKGFVGRVKQISKKITGTHCVLHREALAVKKMPQTLRTVVDEAVKVVNRIKARPLQSRLFKILCEEMGSKHTSLLLHTEVRWLSRGRVLNRLFELRDEVRMFSFDEPLEEMQRFQDKEWLQRLAYLADVFSKLNELNMSLQGTNINIFAAAEKIDAMKRKMEAWVDLASESRVDSFTTLQEYLDESNLKLRESVRSDIVEHLIQLRNNMERYFPTESMERQTAQDWIRDPFQKNHKTRPKGRLVDQLIELRSTEYFREKFSSSSLADFWAEVSGNFPELSNVALRILVPFVSTYLCETGFSLYTATKNKYRNRLDAEPDMRLQLSAKMPNYTYIAAQIQSHPSH